MNALVKILAAAAVLGVVAYLVHRGLDDAARALADRADRRASASPWRPGAAVYGDDRARAGIPEARQIVDLFARRLRRGRV